MYANTNTPLHIPGERIVVGGDASKSILFHRTESIDPTIAMPPVAKNVADQNGVDLIELWINQLDPNYVDPTINASTYMITNAGSGLVMNIADASQANLADVNQWTYVAGANQQFILTPAEGNYYRLKAVHSNKNVDVEGLGQAPGTNVIQYQQNSSDAQFFSFVYLGDEKYAIISKANGLYLGIENNSTINGGSIKTYPNDGSDFFKWTFTDLTLSVEDLDAKNNLRIYTTILPKTLFIKGQLIKATTANLYDIHGRLVLSQVLNPNSTENAMDISTVSTGVYFVKVSNDNQVKTQKVLIK